MLNGRSVDSPVDRANVHTTRHATDTAVSELPRAIVDPTPVISGVSSSARSTISRLLRTFECVAFICVGTRQNSSVSPSEPAQTDPRCSPAAAAACYLPK